MKSCHPIVSIFLMLILFMGITSCSTRSRKILSQDKMVAVIEDLYLADAIIRNRHGDFGKEEYKEALMEGVLKKHNITQAELDSSIVWYVDNVALYSQIQDSVGERLEKRRGLLEHLQASMYKYNLSGFTTELPLFYVLDDNNSIFSFKIDSNNIGSFDKEKFKFSFKISGVDTTKNKVETKLYYRYKDTIVVDQLNLSEDSYYEFVKPNLKDSLLQEISGYIRLRIKPNKGKSIILLNDIKNIEKNLEMKADSIMNDSISSVE